MSQLQEKSSEVTRLEKQLGDLRRAAELGSQVAEEEGSREREQLQVRSKLPGGGAECFSPMQDLFISVVSDALPTLVKFIHHYSYLPGGLGCP